MIFCDILKTKTDVSFKQFQNISTARKDYRVLPIRNVYKKFLSHAISHIVHRYHTLLEKVYWEQYIDEVDRAR